MRRGTAGGSVAAAGSATGHFSIVISRTPLPAEGHHFRTAAATASDPRGGGCDTGGGIGGRSDGPLHDLDVLGGLEVSVIETDSHTLNPLRVRDWLQPRGESQSRRVGGRHAVTPSPPPFSGIVMVSQMILKIG